MALERILVYERLDYWKWITQMMNVLKMQFSTFLLPGTFLQCFFLSNIEGEVWMPLGTEMNVWPMRYQSGSGNA